MAGKSTNGVALDIALARDISLSLSSALLESFLLKEANAGSLPGMVNCFYI